VRDFEGRMGEIEGRMEDLEELGKEPEELRDSWLAKNVAAEGEVTVLRERVDQQERKIQRLVKEMERALDIILELRTSVTPGEFKFLFYFPGINFF
jgi:predicted  nucleic acid-binding Zn-ribbon protein